MAAVPETSEWVNSFPRHKPDREDNAVLRQQKIKFLIMRLDKIVQIFKDTAQ